MSATNTLGLRRPATAPAIFTALYSALIVAIQVPALYTPASSQEMLGIPDATSARFIAFCLIAIKGYELIGALQDNWAVYWFAVVGRIGAASMMLSVGGGWAKTAPFDFGSAAVLAGCMWFSSRSGEKGERT
ncbi:hypothetical protein CLAFUW4_07930 [Fulvia fulva]|uniref:Uncharacterized protein n=1 Tax=Passalora fulva TaxID=5499 RepID=A0A9Q8LD72_PASFU|nr:uncharacterized protein CLAFUR5_08054 [Fulvia fulva]KAK4629001.1 hypothetical protein CLAFUR4_07935 [Fulvia fulva]KAK4630282.1 hypothetical protein CLAFUR0_07932 [Fulvia fulva]UJO15214.1 hypothetical protein CLAFUR5_08054 [Fulvia fulva]WPV12382.1 hypothetical protein CLAFUW4_07930 [Fulvia fulva]WPV27298.1 hypothetical protein CLAFUW7_07931 [Fulvia fulva]